MCDFSTALQRLNAASIALYAAVKEYNTAAKKFACVRKSDSYSRASVEYTGRAVSHQCTGCKNCTCGRDE